MPTEVLEPFLRGEHTIHHKDGIFNGIWSDMGIETTYMRYGHGPSGIIGFSTQPETLKVWAYSHHACSEIVSELHEMRDEILCSSMEHKEEKKCRITSDKADRDLIREKLKVSIDPLNPETHPPGLINIVTGKVNSHSEVNVDNAVALGTKQLEQFEASWPEGFHGTIHKEVKTMAYSKKHIKIGDTKIYDPETIYARAMLLRSCGQGIDPNILFAHEISLHPTSMFDSNGEMRAAKNKSSLVEISGRCIGHVEAMYMDGSAVLWVIPWPAKGTVQDYINRFRHHIENQVAVRDVYLVFDR